MIISKYLKRIKKGLAGKFQGRWAGRLLESSLDQSCFSIVKISIKHKAFDEFGDPVVYQVQDEEGCVSDETQWVESDVTKTTIPFVKNNEFDYKWMLNWAGETASGLVLGCYPFWVVIVVVTAVSNGANMTDGLDGLAGGTSAISGLTLAIFAYLGSNIFFADFLNIMFIPNSEELVILHGSLCWCMHRVSLV